MRRLPADTRALTASVRGDASEERKAKGRLGCDPALALALVRARERASGVLAS